MTTIKNNAKNVKPFVEMQDITSLPKIDINIETEELTFTNSEGKEFTGTYFKNEDRRVRVPKTVLQDLQKLLEEYPNMQYFKVKKQGSGLNTKYTTIPVLEGY